MKIVVKSRNFFRLVPIRAVMNNYSVHICWGLMLVAVSCTAPDPDQRPDGEPGGSAPIDHPMCTANQPLRCDGDTLMRCNADGTAEVGETCGLGCNATDVKCADLVPSNSLANNLESTLIHLNVNLGDYATIDTDTGEVTVDGAAVRVVNGLVAQAGGPDVRVVAVRSLTTQVVTVTGKYPLAIISTGDIIIGGEFSASAKANVPGAGAYHDGDCVGQSAPDAPDFGIPGNSGGGGFGSAGGAGGDGDNTSIGLGIQSGAAGGKPTGNASLVPLRGGCAGGSGRFSTDLGGAGGGAIQLSSRTRIVVSGSVAANGGGAHGGGGSGGGILLEAPIVEVFGGLFANGGSGHGCALGRDGELGDTAAQGGAECAIERSAITTDGRGGNGAAGHSPATDGGDGYHSADDIPMGFGGAGGGGFGRIRINTAPGGAHLTGVISPEPSKGPVAMR